FNLRFNQVEKPAPHAAVQRFIRRGVAVKTRDARSHARNATLLRNEGHLLGRDADFAPVRKSVEPRRKGQLLLAGAVRIDQDELELTASPYTSMENDLLAIGRGQDSLDLKSCMITICRGVAVVSSTATNDSPSA